MKIFYKKSYLKLKKEFKEMVDIKDKGILEREEKIKRLNNCIFDLMSKNDKLEKMYKEELKYGTDLAFELGETQNKYTKSYKENRNKTRKIHQLEKQIEDYKTEGRYLIKKLPDDKATSKQTMKTKSSIITSKIAKKMKVE